MTDPAILRALLERIEAYQKMADGFAKMEGGMRMGDLELIFECLVVLLNDRLASPGGAR